MFVTAELLAEAPGSRGVQKTKRFRFLEHKEFQIFLLKDMMYVTQREDSLGALRGWVCNEFYIKYRTECQEILYFVTV
jgi:hypothetical protein